MNPVTRYRDRREAGRILGARLRERPQLSESVVLALPRGGVPVGLEVARAIDAPLDVFVVRKLGAPNQPELALGAIASGGFEVLNRPLIDELGVTPIEIAVVADREVAELARRERLYRGNRPSVDVGDRTVILVDDGLATGFTMRAAIEAVRNFGARRLVAAVPVGSPRTCGELTGMVDELLCPLQPSQLGAVGLWYEDFSATSDEEVQACLAAPGEAHLAHGQRGCA